MSKSREANISDGLLSRVSDLSIHDISRSAINDPIFNYRLDQSYVLRSDYSKSRFVPFYALGCYTSYNVELTLYYPKNVAMTTFGSLRSKQTGWYANYCQYDNGLHESASIDSPLFSGQRRRIISNPKLPLIQYDHDNLYKEGKLTELNEALRLKSNFETTRGLAMLAKAWINSGIIYRHSVTNNNIRVSYYPVKYFSSPFFNHDHIVSTNVYGNRFRLLMTKGGIFAMDRANNITPLIILACKSDSIPHVRMQYLLQKDLDLKPHVELFVNYDFIKYELKSPTLIKYLKEHIEVFEKESYKINNYMDFGIVRDQYKKVVFESLKKRTEFKKYLSDIYISQVNKEAKIDLSKYKFTLKDPVELREKRISVSLVLVDDEPIQSKTEPTSAKSEVSV